MAKIYPVIIQLTGEPAKHYSADFQTAKAYGKGWKATLIRAHSGGNVKCGCPGQGAKELAVRRYDSDAFCLARYPLSGEDHVNDCRFYAPNPTKSGMSGYQKSVIEEGPNGVIKIRLEIGLKKRSASVAAPTHTSPTQNTGRNSKAAMRLLGLLHFLWEEANLNTWWPAMKGKRNLGLINRKLNEAASQIVAARIPLDSVLLFPENQKDGVWAATNQARVAKASAAETRLLAIVPLAYYSEERSKEMARSLKISGFYGIPSLDMPHGLWQRTCQRFPRAIAAWGKQQRVMAIVELDLKKDGKYANVVDLALMPVTQNWIPFDSMYEFLIAEKLVAEERGFIKPLRFDADEDVVFPDFILRDTGQDTPMEVFGRTDEAYEARKAIKAAYYQKEFGSENWWHWNAARDPEGMNIPPFPPSRRKNND